MKGIVAIALALSVIAGSAMAQSDRAGKASGAGTAGSRDGGAGIAPGSGTGHASDPSRLLGDSMKKANSDQAVDNEDKVLERKLHSICKGC